MLLEACLLFWLFYRFVCCFGVVLRYVVVCLWYSVCLLCSGRYEYLCGCVDALGCTYFVYCLVVFSLGFDILRWVCVRCLGLLFCECLVFAFTLWV